MRKCIVNFFCTSNHHIHAFKFLEFSIYSNESQDEQAADAGIPCRPDGPDGDRCTPPTLPPGLIQWILISLGLKIAFPIFHQARISHHHFCRGVIPFLATPTSRFDRINSYVSILHVQFSIKLSFLIIHFAGGWSHSSPPLPPGLIEWIHMCQYCM